VGRAALVALVFLVFAPVARAGCGLTSTPVIGSAPLAVTFTAACESAVYTWDFGDGAQDAGRTVTHVFRAGYWRPTLTSDGGAEPAPPVTSISLSLTGPPTARYAQRVTLRATVTPRLPVTLNGRRFIAGKLSVRVLGAAPWTARAGNVSATIRIRVTPKLVVKVVGSPLVGEKLRVVATLHPAAAGAVITPKVIDTSVARLARIEVRTRPAPGWAAVHEIATAHIVLPTLRYGDRGASVAELERQLARQHYAIRRDGSFGSEDLEAVYAFQKVHGLARTGVVDAALWRRILTSGTPAARYPGDHAEIDKTRQVLFIVRGGKVALVVATSTGATGNTPLGTWHVYRKVGGFDWVLYYPSYFLRGFAVHGYPDVPPYPASHGCARIPMWIATTVYSLIPDGSAIYVYA
jgi:peptidoglycan hydrolase-like protein with peptidoglycan-binding domain